ncbi:OmpA family protein [bacterium]|nr:OmpA family protein [bacterium]
MKFSILVCIFLVCCVGCNPRPVPGPDKQGAGTLYGAMVGAGSGAVIGAQVGATTTSSVLVGGSFGAALGAMHGAAQDLNEDEQLRFDAEASQTKEVLYAQQVLSQQLERRMRLHPNRDIYPADVFFDAGDVKLKCGADSLVKEITSLSRGRFPWSRLVVASYVTSANPKSDYAKYLAKKRGEAIATQIIRSGIDPKRVAVQPITMKDPLVFDPEDNDPMRYYEAVEIVLPDR